MQAGKRCLWFALPERVFSLFPMPEIPFGVSLAAAPAPAPAPSGGGGGGMLSGLGGMVAQGTDQGDFMHISETI